MQVTVDRGESSLIDRYAEEWRALCAEGPCRAPFYSPEWARAYYEAFAPNAEVVFIIVREGHRLRGLLPLTAARWRGIPWGRRWLRSMGNVHSPRFDVVHGADDGEAVAAAVSAFLQTWRGWDVIHCQMVAEDSVLFRTFRRMNDHGAPLRAYGRAEVPYVALLPTDTDVESLLLRQSRNLRSNLRRSTRRMEEHGEVRVTRRSVESPLAEVTADLARFYELEAAGWKGEAGTAILHIPAQRRFYEAVTRLAHASGELHIIRIEAGDETAAVMLSVTNGHAGYALKMAINEPLRACSPGQLAIMYQCALSAQTGHSVLDLGGKPEGYKRAWTDQARSVGSYVLFAPTRRGRSMHRVIFEAGPWLRARLPKMPIPMGIRRLLGE